MAGRADGREIQIVSTRHFKRPSACGAINTRPCGCWVLAHPDDESMETGGTLYRHAGAGIDVHLLCVTRGGEGCRASLPARRRRTCRATLAVVARSFLYRALEASCHEWRRSVLDDDRRDSLLLLPRYTR